MVRVVILTTRGLDSYYMINRILQVGRVEGIVFQRKTFKSKVALLKRRRRRLGLWAVLNQVLLLLYCHLVESGKESRVITEVFSDQPFDLIVAENDTDVLEVDDINSAMVRSFITSKAPDLVILCGTSLIKKSIIEAAQGRIINIHGGITPEYRSNYGGFWAIYNGEPQMVGVTVLLIDTTLDTGPIVFQETVAFSPEDGLGGIAHRLQKRGVDLLIKAIRDFDETRIIKTYTKADSPSKLYFSPGLSHYLKVKRAGLL